MKASSSHLSPLVIKLNNFVLYSSAGCVIPYLSVYLLHYTRATSTDVGRVMLASSFLGMLLSLTLCSIADRYLAHRRVYLTSLGLAQLSFLVLLVPILLPAIDNQQVWFHLASLAVAIGSMATTVNFNLADCFSINVARKCKQLTFGQVRLFAPLGFIFASSLLIGLNKLLPTNCVVYLGPALIVYVLFATANILLVALWPDARPFDMSEVDQPPLEEIHAKCSPTSMIRFKSKRRFSFWTINLTSGTNERTTSSTSCKLQAVEQIIAFDGREENQLRNIRRCSLAPLGDSYLVKQFELEAPAKETSRHFSFVTIIEPNNEPNKTPAQFAYLNKQIIEPNGTAATKWTNTIEEPAPKAATVISLRCHLKVIQLIARRDKNMLRFMVLYAVTGFTVAMNWVYLFPYLESIDCEKFHLVGPLTLISGYLAETLFYQFGPRLIDLTNHRWHSYWLSFVLFILSLRYSLYLLFDGCWWRPPMAPMELIIAVELLQSLSMGVFNCLINEAALKFALEAQHCFPELRRLQLVAPTVEASQLNDKFKLTMVSLSSCCYDGIGVAFGCLAGGWLIERYSFAIMWQTSISLALLVAICNCLLELTWWPQLSERHPRR